MTLVALLALTTQAWATDVYVVGNGERNWLNGKLWDPGAAENKMTEQNGVYSITFTNVDVDDNSNLQFKFAIDGGWNENYGCSSTTEIELNKTISNIENGGNIMFELTEPADVTISFNLSEQTFMISTNGMKVAPSATPVDLTRGTGEKINEWTLTNGMPAGNVLVTVAYKDRTATTVKFGETTITPTSNAVTGYIGFEAAFANQIAATVQNIEPTFNQGQAVDVNAPTITYKSSNTDVIAFKIADGEDLAEGPLNLMLFRAPGTATLTVQYTGTADLGKSSVDLTVTVAEPATLTLATNDVTRGTVEAVVTDPIQFMKCTDANEWDVLGPQGFQGMTMSQASTWTWDPTTGDAKLVYYIEQDGCMHNIGYNEDGNYCIGAGCNLSDFSSDIQGGKFYYTTGVNPVNILAARNSETNLVIPGTYKVIPGSEVTLKATPTEGNLLNGWSTEGLTQNEDGKWTVTVGQTTTLTANFVEKTYTVKMAENTADAAKWQGSLDGGQSYADLPIVSVKNNPVTLKYNGRLKVKSVTATTDAATAGPTYNERKRINDGPVTVAAGEHWLITGTGTQTSNTITIADGATVTLYGVNISSSSYCIKCAGDATIILKNGSTNTLTSTSDEYPALWAGDANTTLTIQGATGVLNVTSGDFCAGIGGGWKNTDKTCGNITIEGGVITAQGGSCAPGIGSDKGDAVKCGNITITNGVTRVTATKGGEEAPYSIGASDTGSCGTIIIGCTLDTYGNPVGGTKYWENNAAVNDYADSYLRQATIIYPLDPLDPFHARIYK